MNAVVRGGRLLRGGKFETADLLVRDGRIEAVLPPGAAARGPTIDGRGCLVLPALVDAHVHFREPGLEWKEGWESGSRAAARGGVGTVLEVQNNEPLTTDPERLAERHGRAGAKSIVDYGLYANLVPDALGRLRELAGGSAGFKAFLGGSPGREAIEDYGTALELFEAASATGRPVVVHAEDPFVLRSASGRRIDPPDPARERPAGAETIAAAAAIECGAATGAEVHLFHVSAARTVDLLEDAKRRGLRVSASVGPHYLLFTDDDARRAGGRLRVKPPIRGRADRDRLRGALADGTIDVLATDHAPHPEAEKDGPAPPSGVPSLDLLLPLVFALADETGIALETLLDRASAAPARIFRLKGKGRLEPGADADFVLVDPERAFEVDPAQLASRAGWSPYAGRAMRGAPRATFVRGRAVFDGGAFAPPPHGRAVQVD